VAETALDLLNRVGLEGLTLSAIGRELGVKAPALYWHFEDKQALLDEMATVMHRRMAAATPLRPADTWQDRLRAANHALRDTLLAYRDGARVFSGSHFTGIGHAEQMESTLRLFTAAGFTLPQAVRATMTAHLYTLGFVTEEQSTRPAPDAPPEPYDLAERARALRDFPLTAAAGTEIFADFDTHFAEGLDLLITGIATRYGRAHRP
jgi:AcrR family transcriptional regulator